MRRTQKAKPADLAISVVTVMELRYGAARRQSATLTASVEAFLKGITIPPFDAKAAEQAGVLRATTALVFGLTLVSNAGDSDVYPA